MTIKKQCYIINQSYSEQFYLPSLDKKKGLGRKDVDKLVQSFAYGKPQMSIGKLYQGLLTEGEGSVPLTSVY
jgi:hypothetical protein